MKQDLIFSRNANNATLTLEQIQAKAPAAFTDTKSPDRADRYAHINTSQAIEILADYGYNVTQAAQVRSRTQEANKYAQHLIALSNPDLRDPFEGQPEIILYNSGDGRSALRMFTGFYRFICSNGIVAGNGFEVKARHYQTTASRFEGMIKETAETFPAMMENIQRMKERKLDPDQLTEFAMRAAAIRWQPFNTWEEKPGTYSTFLTASQLMQPKRQADVGPDLWRSLNIAQEGLIRGGVSVHSVTDKQPAGKTRSARAIGSVKASLDINRQLWDLVADYYDQAKIEEAA
jgi:hypothetical protein